MTTRICNRSMAWLALVAMSAWPLAAPAQSMNVKAGGWETTYTTRADLPGMPLEMEKMMERLTPAQRAKSEAQFRESWNQTSMAKTCLTKSDLAEMAKGPDDDNSSCKRANVKVSSTRWEADMNCEHGRSGHAVFNAPSSNKVSGNIVMRMPTSKGDGKTTIEISARWASASCKGYDD